MQSAVPGSRMPAGVCRCWTLCCRWIVRSFAKVSRGGSTRALRWRWNFPAARHGWPGTQTPQNWQAFCPSAGASAILDGTVCPPPDGWHKAEALTVFGLPQAGPLPLPAVDEALWAKLSLCREAPAARVAAALYPADPARQADFYSELCTKRSRGRAVAWTLEQGSTVVCTVGAYALCNGQAYMACGKTAEPLRGKGIGGRLIVEMANSLAAEGLRPVFLCAPERVRFYTRLGFAKQAEYARYVPEKC